ncbi:Aerobic respiration control protein ArcA [Marinomonas spartinae]|uniref:Aerobic respiration control protein ArcA n=1 Tax=Marinomonas spartinae TaxID=1792290 RepID=A0A1A8TC71_9GAMM|nr:response regulator [Marinomonas spartinae]SBS29813.1 Aerobic respiration control protein ArcA [Marinomonas spartinae]
MKLITQEFDHTPTVLLVDDQPSVAFIVKKILEGYCELLYASHLSKAHELLIKTEVDLVLLDIELQGETGWNFIEQLKAIYELSDLPPIMFITGHTGSEIEEKALELGAADFIIKPIVPAILKMRVMNLLRIKSLDRQAVFYKNQLEDMVKHSAMVISFWSSDWQCLYFRDSDQEESAPNTVQLVDIIPASLASKVMQIGTEEGSHQVQASSEIDDGISGLTMTMRHSNIFGDYIFLSFTRVSETA